MSDRQRGEGVVGRFVEHQGQGRVKALARGTSGQLAGRADQVLDEGGHQSGRRRRARGGAQEVDAAPHGQEGERVELS